MAIKRLASNVPPARQLDSFIARFSPPVAKLTKAVLKTMRERLPGSVELVYDKANALAIGFGPDERASNIINSIAVYSNWINLYFFAGDHLPDPDGLLQGSGTTVRHIRITAIADLNRPAVKALMAAALRAADPPLERGAKRRIVIKQVSRGTKVGGW
jgi:hypothetical protein